MSGDDYFNERLIRLQPSDSWVKESGSEDELTVVFIKAGAGTCIFQNSTQRLMPGNLLFFSGQTNGKLSADSKSDCVFSAFSVLLEHIFPLFAGNEIGLLHSVAGKLKTAMVYAQNHPVAVETKPLLENLHLQSRIVQRSQLLRIVAGIIAEEFKSLRGQQTGLDWAEDRMIQGFEKLSSAELLNLSVDELAAKFSCSRRHLNRLFHQHFNLSITSLRMEIRLLKAVSLLRDPRAKVINVAEQCGFNHLGLFNTCFKRRFGTSPGQWRKATVAGGPAAPVKPGNQLVCPLQASRLCPLGAQSAVRSLPGKLPVAGISPPVAAAFPDQNQWDLMPGGPAVTDVRHSGAKIQPKGGI